MGKKSIFLSALKSLSITALPVSVHSYKYAFVISLVVILYNYTEQDLLRAVGHAVGCGFPVKEVTFHVF